MNAPVLLEPAAAADPAAAKEPSRLERARGLFSTTSTPTPPPPPHPSHDVPLDEFLHELSTLAWVPVLTEPPLPLLPWDAAQCARCFAPPSAVRPVDEMWLVSYSCRLLDGEARSDALRRALGWHTRPNLFVLAAQLSALAAHEPTDDERTRFLQSMAAAVPALYQALEDIVVSLDGGASDDDLGPMFEQLAAQPCVWVGSRFVRPARAEMKVRP